MVEDRSTLEDKSFVSNGCCEDRREACDKLINVRFEALNNVFEGKLAAADKARELAAAVLTERLEKLNELRQMASDRDSQFVTKNEFNNQVINIEQLRLSEAKLSGKADTVAVDKVDKRAESANNRGNLGIIIAIVTLLFSIAIHFIK